MTIPIQPVHLGNGQVISDGAAPNPLMLLLQAMTQAAPMGAQAYQESQNRSISSAQLDLQKQEMAFRIAQEKTRQEQIKHQQEVAKQQGEATKIALGPIMEHLQATGQMAQMLPPQAQQPTPAFNPQGPAGQPLPAIQQTQGAPMAPPPPQNADVRLTKYLATMDPEAAAEFASKTYPHILEMRKALLGEDSKGQSVQLGDQATTFIPGKGYWDKTANGGKGGFVPSMERHLSQDQKDEAAQNRALREAQIAESHARTAAMQAYKQRTQAQSMTNQFNNRLKFIRERGAAINQGLLTLTDAQGTPILTTSAVVNFVQAADQKAQLRIQLVKYFTDKVDQSVAGRWDVLKERLISGKYPPRIYTGMIKHLNNLLDLHRKEYERQRAGEIKRHPELANWLPPGEEFFTPETADTTTPPPSLDDNFAMPPRP